MLMDNSFVCSRLPLPPNAELEGLFSPQTSARQHKANDGGNLLSAEAILRVSLSSVCRMTTSIPFPTFPSHSSSFHPLSEPWATHSDWVVPCPRVGQPFGFCMVFLSSVFPFGYLTESRKFLKDCERLQHRYPTTDERLH